LPNSIFLEPQPSGRLIGRFSLAVVVIDYDFLDKLADLPISLQNQNIFF
jgi:hypothetical protein